MTNKKIVIMLIPMFLGILNSLFAGSPDWTIIAPGGNIQTAIDSVASAGGGVVYLEAGTHTFSTTISLKNKVTLMGAGRAATVLEYTGNSGAAIECQSIYNWAIKELYIKDCGNGEYGIFLNNSPEGRIEDVLIKYFSETGIMFNNNSWSNRITNCVITYNGDGIFLGNQSNAVVIYGCQIGHNTGSGIQVSYANGCQIIANQLEQNGNGIHIAGVGSSGLVKGLKINNNYFEEPTLALLIDEGHGYSQNVENLTFSDNYIWSAGADYSVVSNNPNGLAMGMLSNNHFWGVNVAGVHSVSSGDRFFVTGVRAYGATWDTGSTKPLLDNNSYNSASSSLTVSYKKIALKDVVNLEPRSTAPYNAAAGDIYFNGTTAKLMYYDGSAWKTIATN